VRADYNISRYSGASFTAPECLKESAGNLTWGALDCGVVPIREIYAMNSTTFAAVNMDRVTHRRPAALGCWMRGYEIHGYNHYIGGSEIET
jgi:hypothetical protein